MPGPVREASRSVHFYRFNEVDSPAEPTAEWAIEIELLEALGLQRIAFEILVDERGRIVGCTLLDPPAMSEEPRARIEEQIRATSMVPASRAGQAVPSLRRIELFFTEQPS